MGQGWVGGLGGVDLSTGHLRIWDRSSRVQDCRETARGGARGVNVTYIPYIECLSLALRVQDYPEDVL